MMGFDPNEYDPGDGEIGLALPGGMKSIKYTIRAKVGFDEEVVAVCYDEQWAKVIAETLAALFPQAKFRVTRGVAA